MKKILIIVLALTMMLVLVGCGEDTLADKLEGEWLLLERHMVIELKTEDYNYVEFKDAFDLESKTQTRHIRYDKESDFELESERANNITSFYTQSFDMESCSVENYIKTENTHYIVTYGDDEISYKLDEEKSNKELVDVYEINGFTNQVAFDGDKIILTMVLTAEDLADDPTYAEVKTITATMTLEKHEWSNDSL